MEKNKSALPSWTPAIGLAGVSIGVVSILWALYARPEVAAELGVSTSTVRKWVQRRILVPARRGARPLRFDPRQVRALVNRTDALVCFSTSGTSPNIVSAMNAAHTLGAYAVLVTGADAPTAAQHVLRAPCAGTRAIQESHVLMAHQLVEQIEGRLGV